MTTRTELWLKHRPRSFKEVVGQDTAVKMLEGYVRNNAVPHALLITGESGTGKSTLAHILVEEMGCRGLDKQVVNCATEESPIQKVRELQHSVKLSPSPNSKCRVWILEELQSWSKTGFAQQAMLLMLEGDTESTKYSYLIGCTTNPEKLKEAIRTRCKKVETQSLSSDSLKILLSRIAEKEGRNLPDSVMEAIIEVAAGSAREAINQLDSAFAMGKDEEDMLAIVSSTKETDKAWKLKQALFWQKPKWNEICEIIKDIPRSEKEKFRHEVLKISAGAMLKNDKFSERAAFVVDKFMDSWENCMESGLENACWQVYREFGK